MHLTQCQDTKQIMVDCAEPVPALRKKEFSLNEKMSPVPEKNAVEKYNWGQAVKERMYLTHVEIRNVGPCAVMTGLFSSKMKMEFSFEFPIVVFMKLVAAL